jgi:hypothetical protein
MKRVIDGKVYNTETATKIATDSFSNRSDFHFWVETLYVTKKGRFFLKGEGGALSRWSQPYETGGTCGGEGIVAMTKDEARRWCEAHEVNAETICRYFEIEEA